ncbi:MAG: 50S ribosomal protein L18 [Candidatus Hydrothermarchaeales archaeon]
MAQKTTYKVPKRRKREEKTNYRKRLTLLLSHKPRLVVRKSHSHVVFQIIEYHPKGDRILISAHSKELTKFGHQGHGGNAHSGYLVGFLGGGRAVKSKVTNAVFDIGLVSPVKGSTVFAVLLGALDAGLTIPHNKDILPPKEKFSDLEKVKKKIATGA